MKRDYLSLLRESFNFTLKYKILWIFGIFLSTASGGGNSFNFPGASSPSGSGSKGGSPIPPSTYDQVDKFVQSPTFWIAVAGIVLFVVLISILFWYLNKVAQTAVVRSVVYDQEGESEKIKFKPLWGEARPLLGTFIKYDLLWLIIILPLVLLLIFPVLFAALSNMLYLLFPILCIGVPILIIALVIVGQVNSTGTRLIILKGYKPTEAIVYAWNIFKREWVQYLLAGLVFLIPGFIFGVALLAVTFVLLLVFAIPALVGGLLLNSIGVGLAIGVVMLILFVLLLAAIKAPYAVLSETYWTKFILPYTDTM